ncbi:class I SAM-dependent methyltransferase, partial [Escherichia coli]|uniref:class I SAM-dependent methyltransferase n=1 Tax=Escherichia coli TaxID=562 RepID=UPI0013D033FB
YPGLSFAQALLPELAGIADASFDNVLCETVIMHLEPEAIAPAVARLAAILKPGGTLYLTWRTTEGQGQRDAHGRLYAAFDK